jgi:flagellar hook protein FlgE
VTTAPTSILQLTTKHDTSIPGRTLNVGDFTTSTVVRAAAFLDNATSGDRSTVTPRDQYVNALSGSGIPARSRGLSVGDTITVNGNTITFTASGGLDDANNIPIDALSALAPKDRPGTATSPISTVTNRFIVLHTGIANLAVSSSNAAFGLGFDRAVNALAAAPLARREGLRTRAFIRIDFGGATTGTIFRFAGQHPVPLAKMDATLGPGHRQIKSVLSGVRARGRGGRQKSAPISLSAEWPADPGRFGDPDRRPPRH